MFQLVFSAQVKLNHSSVFLTLGLKYFLWLPFLGGFNLFLFFRDLSSGEAVTGEVKPGRCPVAITYGVENNSYPQSYKW